VTEARRIPAWPFWILIVIGPAVAIVGLGLAVDLPEQPAISPEVGGWIALAGGLILLAGLLGLAWRALVHRRHLPDARYRGPSVILLFLIVIVGGNIASIPLLPALLGDAIPDPLTISIILVLTPTAFLIVTWLFVLRPGALRGLRLADGERTGANLVRGLMVGIPVWLVATLMSAGIVLVWEALIGEAPDPQVALELIRAAPLLAALVGAGVLAPIAEELFFRGVVFNAWEREYGRMRAIIGSSVLFAAVHMLDGAILAFAPLLIVGLALAIFYDRTRSLPLVIGAHAAFNVATTLVVFLA
jgi:uncharacterized protein